MSLLAIRTFLGKLPREVWYALALALAVWLAFRWYDGQIDAAEKRGAQAENARLTAKALELKRKTDALTRQIADNLRSRNDDQARRIAAAADDLRLRGPGKAACPRVAGLPAAAGGRVAPGGAADAARPPVPADDRAAVPWPWLVERAERCDLNRSEILSWREWYQKVSAAWPKSEAS